MTIQTHSIQKLIDGGQSEFEEIYLHYYSRLLRTAYRRLANQQLAEEVVQDVFVNLWSKRATLDRKGNLKSYLYATLRKRVLHELRTVYNKNKYFPPGEADADVIGFISPEDEVIGSETAKRVNKVIDNLPTQCRHAFVLSRFHNLSYKEIADEMQVSVSTVEKHISFALKRLRAKLGQHTLLLLAFGLNPPREGAET